MSATPLPASPDAPADESRIILLIGAVQFVNVLDFMMVMPLGPDFARALDIPAAHLGIIGGTYTASAAVSGLLGMAVLDRMDRRAALLLTMVGLFVGTIAGAAAVGFKSLLAARALAGAFGGPATAVALAVLSDAVPAERRGRALGKVMGAFSVASVLGVPAGLELARLGGWRFPFVVVSLLGLVVAFGVRWWLPSLRGHLGGGPRPGARAVLAEPGVLASSLVTGLAPLGAFALIPNIPTYFQVNLGYPRERFGLLYLVGGLFSFLILRIGGRAVDRFGSSPVAALGTLLLTAVVVVAFITPTPAVPAMALFVGFMMAMGLRNVSITTLTSRVPRPASRAGFLSLQSASQHAFAASGAMVSSVFLTTRPDGGLIGMDRTAQFTLVVSFLMLVPMVWLERRLPVGDAKPPARG